jgi:hypothetical protein
VTRRRVTATLRRMSLIQHLEALPLLRRNPLEGRKVKMVGVFVREPYVVDLFKAPSLRASWHRPGIEALAGPHRHDHPLVYKDTNRDVQGAGQTMLAWERRKNHPIQELFSCTTIAS